MNSEMIEICRDERKGYTVIQKGESRNTKDASGFFAYKEYEKRNITEYSILF